PVTTGKWEVRSVLGIDENAGTIYFSATEHSPIAAHVYRVQLDGSRLERLSRREGGHTPKFNSPFSFYIDQWSDASTPVEIRLHKNDGSEVRVIHKQQSPAIAGYRLSKPEFLQVKTRDGFLMEAEMIKPPDFDPSRRYPVYQYTYGGPHAPSVRNSWMGSL